MEFKYSTASDYAITVRIRTYSEILDWVETGILANDAAWITFPLSKVAYAAGFEEKGRDGKLRRYATFILDCGKRVGVVEDEDIRKILVKTMWKNVFGPEEGEFGPEEGEEEETSEED